MGVIGLTPFLLKALYVNHLQHTEVKLIMLPVHSPQVIKSVPERAKALAGKTLVL
jgi:hypothetical protein